MRKNVLNWLKHCLSIFLSIPIFISPSDCQSLSLALYFLLLTHLFFQSVKDGPVGIGVAGSLISFAQMQRTSKKAQYYVALNLMRLTVVRKEVLSLLLDRVSLRNGC